MPLLIKMAGKPVIAISGVGTAPAKATPAFYKQRPMEAWEKPGHMPPIPGQGIRSAILPGVFDGLILALQEYGTMSFEQVSAPAIEYAEGFPIAEEFADAIRSALASDEPVTATTTYGEPGTEPSVAVLVGGLGLFRFRRDEFLEAVYVASCDVLEELRRDGRPLVVES
jgi:gamma-glutamyltranspeptidase